MIKVTFAGRVRYAVVQFGSFYMYTAGCFPTENTRAFATYTWGDPPGNHVHNEHNDSPVSHSNCKGELIYAGKFRSEYKNGKQICYDYNGDELISIGGSYWNEDSWPIGNAGKNSGSRSGYEFQLSLQVDGDTVTASVKYTKTDYICTVPLTEQSHKFVFPAGYGILQYSWKQPIYWPGGGLRKVDTLSLQVTLGSWHGCATPDNQVMLEARAKFGAEVFPARTMADLATAARNWYSQLRTEAIIKSINKLRYIDINSLAYSRDLKEFNQSNRKLLRALRAIKKPKNWANLWLSYRYGIRLFILDSIKIGESIKKAFANPKASETFVRSKVDGFDMGNLTNCEIDLTSRSKIYLSTLNTAEMNLINAVRRFDFMPSLVNIWDFVPYSFVIDWIIPVGDLFARLDAAMDIMTFPITGGVTSLKVETQLKYSSFHGTVKFSLYNRKCETQAELSRLSMTAGLHMMQGFSDSDKSIKHGVDTLALLSQRIR